MYFRIIGNDFTKDVFKEIEAITDVATMYFRKVEYDKDKKIVSIPIARYKIKGKRFLSFLIPTNYKRYNIKIPSKIIIRNVVKCKIENNFEESDSEMIVLFGLAVNGNKMFISSAEEDHTKGGTCYTLDIEVSEIDIEIKDDITNPE